MKEKIKTFKSVGIVMSFTILSVIFSALLQIILAYLYGTKGETDVYFLTLSIPLLISGILVSTISVVFIPILREFVVKDKQKDLVEFVNTTISYFIVILSIVTAILFFSSGLIISKIAPAFSLESKLLAIFLLRVLSFSIIPTGLYSLLVAVYYSKELFLKPGVVRSITPLVVIGFVLGFNRFLGIKSLAYGFVLGCLVQFFTMFYFLKRGKTKFQFSFNFSKANIGWLWQRSLVVLGGLFLFGLIVPAEKFLASNLSSGSVSYLGYVERIVSIIILFPHMAIPTVILPQMAGHYAVDNIAKLRSTFSSGIRSTFFITLPLVTIFLIFREPIIHLFLQRGAFGRNATINTAATLACYMAVFFESERLIILNTLFAMKDVVTPFIVGIVAFISFLLLGTFLSIKMSFLGIALAHSAAFLIYCIASLIILRVRLGHIDGARISLCGLKLVISSVASGIIMWLIYNLSRRFLPLDSFIPIFLRLFVSIFMGIISYLGFCLLLRLQELKQFYKIIVSYSQQIILKTV